MESLLYDNEQDARDKVIEFLETRGTTKKWLASKISLSPSSLTRILNKERKLTQDTLDKINEVLKTDFTL